MAHNSAPRSVLWNANMPGSCENVQLIFRVQCPVSWGHTKMKAPWGQQSPAPLCFHCFIGYFLLLVRRIPRFLQPQRGVRLPEAVLQEDRRRTVTPLENWQQSFTPMDFEKMCLKLLWENPSDWLLPQKRKHAYLSPSLIIPLVSLPFKIPSHSFIPPSVSF